MAKQHRGVLCDPEIGVTITLDLYLRAQADLQKRQDNSPSPTAQGGGRTSFQMPGRDSHDNRYPTNRMSQSQSMSGAQMQSFNGRPSPQDWQIDVQGHQQGRVVSSPHLMNGRAPQQGPGQYRSPPPGQERGMGDRSQSMGFPQQQQRPSSQSSMGTSTATHGANTSNSPSTSDQTQGPRYNSDSAHNTPRGSPGLQSAQPPHTMNSGDATPPTAIGQAPGTDMPPPAAWTRPFQPIVELIGLQPAKVYGASPPELEMIIAKTSSGAVPKCVIAIGPLEI